MKDQNTPTNTLNHIIIELQRIFDQFNDGELIDQPLSQGEAIRRIESLISEAVNKARLELWSEVDTLAQGYRSYRMSDIAQDRIKKLETTNQVEREK